MKKIILIVFALGLLLPMNSSAYTTFVALDQSVVDASDFSAAEFLLGLPAPGSILTSLIVPGPFNFTDIDGVTTYDYGASVSPFNGLGDGSTTTAPDFDSDYAGSIFGGALTQPGVLFYYLNDTMVVPNLVSTIEPGNYDLIKVFDFESYTGGIPLGDGTGALYTISQVPVPSAIFLLAPGLLALFGLRRKLS